MITLIDGDLITWRCSASAENEGEQAALERCTELIKRICQDTQATHYELYINGSSNFRYDIDPMYKAHRKDVVKPKYLEQCREHLIVNHQAKMSVDVETDDELGLLATSLRELGTAFCVASLDKDLLQLPGLHYNFVKNIFIEVNDVEAVQSFYRQMLIGDRADNVTGIMGIGEVKAAKAINKLHVEKDMYDLVKALYNDNEKFRKNAQLLWILKKERNPNEVLSHFLTFAEPEEETKQ